MHIRSLIAGAMLCLGMLAYSPVSMADQAPDVCFLDVSQAVSFDLAISSADMACSVVADANVSTLVTSPLAGNLDLLAAPSLLSTDPFAISAHRLHVDPGRVLA